MPATMESLSLTDLSVEDRIALARQLWESAAGTNPLPIRADGPPLRIIEAKHPPITRAELLARRAAREKDHSAAGQ